MFPMNQGGVMTLTQVHVFKRSKANNQNCCWDHDFSLIILGYGITEHNGCL